MTIPEEIPVTERRHDTIVENMRQEELRGRLHDIHSLNFNPASFGRPQDGEDILMSAERYMDGLPALSFDAISGDVTKVIPEAMRSRLASLHRCAEAIVHLMWLSDTLEESAMEITPIARAKQVYTDMLQYHLGFLFIPEHPFCRLHFSRLQSRYSAQAERYESTDLPKLLQQLQLRLGLYSIALDAANQLVTGRTYKVQFQLSLQSLKWALAGYYLPSSVSPHDRLETLRNALRLVESIHLPTYKHWIRFQLFNKTKPEN